MRILALSLITMAALSGCVVIPAEPSAVVSAPGVYVAPPPVVVVPARPYYGYRYDGYGRYRYRRYY